MLLSQPPSKSSRSDSIVFIDSSVEYVQQLINGIYPGIEIIVLNPTEDGITQISQVLQQHQNLKTLHLVSHGSPGCLYLGNTQLSLTTLAQYKSHLSSWNKAFSAESPAILLYGCQVAAGDAGVEFVDLLRELTKINIAASAKLRGNRELGGDWELEVRTGEIEVPLAFSEEVREAYAGVLATYTVNTLVDENDGIEDGEISLREAIEAANSSTEADTIEFNAGLSGGTITLVNGELSITDDLTIDGLGSENLTVSGNNISRVFNVNDGDSDNEITVVIDELTITDGNENHAGGIYNAENLTVRNSLITNNSASDGNGGGISNSGTLSVINSRISNNRASGHSRSINGNYSYIVYNYYYYGDGGGIYNQGNLTITNSTVSGNSVQFANGGGLYNTGTLTVTNSTISSNSATSYIRTRVAFCSDYGPQGCYEYVYNYVEYYGHGGGISSRGNLTITNSTVSQNSGRSGSISNTGELSITSSTITQNSQGIDSFGSASQVSNSIISGNLNSDVAGTFSSLGHNLIGIGSGIASFNQVSDVTGVIDPRLEELADNGGSTLTHALLPDSPAVNFGNNALLPPDTSDLDGDGDTSELLPVDQRGEPRIQGDTVDIGAFESNFTDVPLPTVNLTLSNSIALEGEDSVLYRLSRTGSLDSALTIQLSTAGSEGLTSDDFNLTGVTGTFPNFTVTIPAGERQIEFTLSAVEDLTLEIGENFTLNLAENETYQIDSVNNSSSVTILNQQERVLLVNNTNDSGLGSLRQAILNANTFAGLNTIVFAESLSGQTITLTSGELRITDELTIDGLGAENLTISGNNNSRIFSISQDNKVVEIEGLTLTDGSSSDGGAIFNLGDLTLRNSLITGNTASSEGGGIYNWSYFSSQYFAEDDEIRTSSLTVINSTVANNTANAGGGIFNRFGDVILNDSTLSGNTSNTGGGGIFSRGYLAISSQEQEFFIKYFDTGNLSVSNSTITGNTAGSGGGGIFNYASDMQVINSIVSGNMAGTDGGGIFNKGDKESFYDLFTNLGHYYSSGTVTLSNSTISNNQAVSKGGGIWGDFEGDTDLNLINSTISGNQAGSDGGGIWGDFGQSYDSYHNYNRYTKESHLFLDGSTISGNQASSNGGGIWSRFSQKNNNNARLGINNSTISDNTADENGGGIYTSGSSSAYYRSSITNSTITSNIANEDGGGIFNNLELRVGNTIIAANTDNQDIAGNPFNSLGYNLIGNGDGASGFNNTGDQVGTSSNPIDPLLGPLQNNGGPTETHALLEGSPAIDAGSNALIPFEVTTDQRGEPRIQGLGVDIGAYESSFTSSPATLTLSASGTPTEANTTPATFTLSREGNTSGELVVNFSLGGTASLGADYTLSNVNLSDNTLTFTEGQSSLDITLTPIDDKLFGSNETVQLNLLPGSYVLGMSNSASLTILDNDGKVINGTSQSETLIGTDSNDTFNGRGGEDTLTGGLGDDRYTINSAGDVVVELFNEGNDTVKSSVTYNLRAHIENLTLTGAAINGKGNSLDNILKGNAGNNRLQGLAGNDLITGGAGNDTLVGGAGNDILTGGQGADQFLFKGKTFSSLGVDTLTDFVQGSDKLVLSRATFNALETTSGTLVEGELASIRVELAQEMAIAGVSSANLVYNSGSGNLFYNANGADEGFSEGGLLASLTRKPSSLEVSDFLVQV